MKRSFTVVVERDPESRWLVGEVVELPGCYTQAPDLPTLEANIQEAIRAYLLTTDLEEPLPDFVGTWRVEVTAGGSLGWSCSPSRPSRCPQVCSCPLS
jgi:predicted RNase H-like HicB family nuclease